MTDKQQQGKPQAQAREDAWKITRKEFEEWANKYASYTPQIAFIPCDVNDPDLAGGFTSTDGQSLCYVKEIELPSIPTEVQKEESAGVQLIAAERRRQVEVEKWDYKHDEDYKNGELIGAAACYAVNALNKSGIKARVQIYLESETNFQAGNTGDRGDRQLRKAGWYDAWPWDEQWDKRKKHNVTRSLVISGALIAAHLDTETPASSAPPISHKEDEK